MFSVLSQRWRLLTGLSGLLVAVGGSFHPDPDTDVGFSQATAGMLAHSGWVPSHALMLVSFLLLLPALIGLARARALSGAAATVLRISILAVVLGIVEFSFHLAAIVDRSALESGGSTPVLDTHLALAVVAYPAVGFSLAALAVLGARNHILTHPVFAALGVVGGVMHGIAAPIVVLSRNQELSFLFTGAIPLALWLIAVGLTGVRFGRRSTTLEAKTVPAGSAGEPAGQKASVQR